MTQRIRVVAEPTNPEWKAREGREPWCEITIDDDGRVCSFGGEVWPGAWPNWFTINGNNVMRNSYYLTDEGRQALLTQCNGNAQL